MAFTFAIPVTPGPEWAPTIQVPSPNGPVNTPAPPPSRQLSIDPGQSIVFVGANGSGKTRLAVHLEQSLGLRAHRISAHRALSLNTGVAKVTEADALKGLQIGNPHPQFNVAQRPGSRWGNNPATSLLNDFDFLTQVLFAEQNNTAVRSHSRARSGDVSIPDPTKFERLADIWHRLLPHRILYFTGDNITVSANGDGASYNAGDMSDGERAIFYLIAQTLVVQQDTLLIVDEPELHVHPSIMSKLWDELEAERPDCAFIFITHDLAFASQRVGQKFVLSEFIGGRWSIDEVRQQSGFSEATATLILGSRRPILFVEGDESSLDFAMYRCCFPDWTIMPRGSCEQVIHSVRTMRANADLHRICCAGIIDRDGHGASDIERLHELGVAVLSVSEIENLILLPDVSRAIAEAEGHDRVETDRLLDDLAAKIFDFASAHVEEAVVRHCRRRIDREMKRVDLGLPKSEGDLLAAYARSTAQIDIASMAAEYRERVTSSINGGDLPALLAVFDNKGLLQLAAASFRNSSRATFEGWFTRVLRGGKYPAVKAAVHAQLPLPLAG